MFDYRFLANHPSAPEEYTSQQSQITDDPTSSAIAAQCVRRRKRLAQRNITLGYKTTHRLFLIPSLFFFFRITALLMLFCELIMHLWAHRKNSRNTDETVFYRSPLHLFTSEFCGICKSDTGMKRLGQMQDRRREAKRLLAYSGSVH